jgi:hypothetical protein
MASLKKHETSSNLLIQAREATTVHFPDYATATVVAAQALDTPGGPTLGCYRFEVS